MRLFLYVASLIAGAYGTSYFLTLLGWSLAGYFGHTTLASQSALLVAIAYVRYLPFLFFGMRGFIWFKQKRIAPPTSFSGFPYGGAVVAASLFGIMIAGYVVLGIAQPRGGGMSGVPLGMLLMLCGVVLGISTPIVEVRDWLRFFKAPNPS